MQKKRKSPWPFQKVLGSLRHFILLFGAYDSPTLKLVAVPILPLPAVTGITCLLDMKSSFFSLSQAKHEGHHVLSQLFDWLYLPHFLLLKWAVVKYNGVPLPAMPRHVFVVKNSDL